MWRDGPHSLALTRVASELVDIFDGQRACKRGPHPGKVRGRQHRLRSAGVETAVWRLSLSLVDPRDLPPAGRSPRAATLAQCVSRHSMARTRSSAASTAT